MFVFINLIIENLKTDIYVLTCQHLIVNVDFTDFYLLIFFGLNCMIWSYSQQKDD